MNPVIFVKDLREQLAKFDDLDVVVIDIHDTAVGEDLYLFGVDSVDITGNTKEVRLCLIDNN
jgi:hypothetical protein